MLTIEGLDLLYGDAQALDDVSLDVPEGAVTAIIGANGAGKTSLIRTVSGILRPARGSIRFEGREIAGLPSHTVCDLGIGQVAEGRQVFPTMTVRENLEMGAVIPRARERAKANLERMLVLFPRLGERLRQAAGTLSGGEQQMLAIGRCLMGEPRVILFDEPSLGLAPAVVQELFRIIKRLRDEGMTIVLVEQNVAASLHLAATAHVLEQGRIVLSGTGPELLDNPKVQEAYLGL
ncbi:amino acid ABC transporter ATPase [Skermanella stibiiresistens SB22]|uniref:Amino acid ABC transporter ATPase n=1 Tax=Skermanella stibiiresistens SB22 TaxID=1385369 RepID=W9H0Q8_9PROT|nr:ABC transporter ATP-binding protein [Skermanella stibiiresistens]EWY39760.1 amino acid ABC transporter ATPase [Skermanella stibiiresistens SB22]